MKKKLIDILIFIFFAIAIFSGVMFIITFPALAEDRIFSRKVIEVIDGDTVRIDMQDESDLISNLGYTIRIAGIDAPEIEGNSECEKQIGLIAKDFLKKILFNDRQVKIINPKWDKYGGRILADIETDGVLVSKLMIDNGLAITYKGKKKTKIWC